MVLGPKITLLNHSFIIYLDSRYDDTYLIYLIQNRSGNLPKNMPFVDKEKTLTKSSSLGLLHEHVALFRNYVARRITNY